MALVLTYDTLVQKLISYAERPSDQAFIDNIPLFILLAQSRISNDLNILGLQKIVTNTMSTGASVVLKPSRWLRTISFTITIPNADHEQKILELRGLEYCQRYSINSTITGLPVYYGDYDFNSFLISPTPDANYPFQLVYHELLEPLDAVTQQNWITERVPHLLLTACLREAFIFFQSEDRAGFYINDYNECIKSIKNQDNLRLLDRSTNIQVQ